MEDNLSSVWKFQESGPSTLKSNPDWDETYSEFGDWACGEQLRTQHLVVDFTPSDEVDTNFVQKKCCAFWDFVRSSPELRNMMVLPEIIKFDEAINGTTSEERSSESAFSFETVPSETPALTTLKLAENKGIIRDAFEVQLPHLTCSNGSDYPDDEPTAATQCICDACKSCRNQQPKGSFNLPSTPKLKYLCEKMQDWDRDHPKSMEPPGPLPAAKQCVMQRMQRF